MGVVQNMHIHCQYSGFTDGLTKDGLQCIIINVVSVLAMEIIYNTLKIPQYRT